MQARDIMTKDPPTLDVSATVQDAFEAMKQHDVRHRLWSMIRNFEES